MQSEGSPKRKSHVKEGDREDDGGTRGWGDTKTDMENGRGVWAKGCSSLKAWKGKTKSSFF